MKRSLKKIAVFFFFLFFGGGAIVESVETRFCPRKLMSLQPKNIAEKNNGWWTSTVACVQQQVLVGELQHLPSQFVTTLFPIMWARFWRR